MVQIFFFLWLDNFGILYIFSDDLPPYRVRAAFFADFLEFLFLVKRWLDIIVLGRLVILDLLPATFTTSAITDFQNPPCLTWGTVAMLQEVLVQGDILVKVLVKNSVHKNHYFDSVE